MALVTAVGSLAVLSVMLVSVISFSSATSRQSSYARAEQQAQSLAEAGLNQAAARLYNSSGTAVPSTTEAGHEGGSVTYSGSKSGTTWTLIATATVTNPTGGSAIQQTVSEQVAMTDVNTLTGNEAWNYLFSDSTTSCLKTENGSGTQAPLYVRGNLCLENASTYTGVELNVGGKVDLQNGSKVGSSTTRIPIVRVANGCRYNSGGAFTSPCGDAQSVYAAAAGFSASVPAYTKPPSKIAEAFTNSKPGPGRYCTSGSFPGGSNAFDSDVPPVRDADGPTVDMITSSAYDCVYSEGSPLVQKGRIKWTPGVAGSPGSLVVDGTIYFDGELKFDNGDNFVYSGRATIFAGKEIKVENGSRICGVANCDASTWNPNQNFLMLVSGNTGSDAFKLENGGMFQGGVYTVGGAKIENGSIFQGPIIADLIKAENGTILRAWPGLTSLTPGAPSNGTQTTLTYVPRSWRG